MPRSWAHGAISRGVASHVAADTRWALMAMSSARQRGRRLRRSVVKVVVALALVAGIAGGFLVLVDRLNAREHHGAGATTACRRYLAAEQGLSRGLVEGVVDHRDVAVWEDLGDLAAGLARRGGIPSRLRADFSVQAELDLAAAVAARQARTAGKPMPVEPMRNHDGAVHALQLSCVTYSDWDPGELGS